MRGPYLTRALLCYPRDVTDWIGSLRLSERTSERVVLTLSRATRVYGWLLITAGITLLFPLWSLHPWAAVVPAAFALLGVLMVSLQRKLVFDREAGVLRLDQRTLGLTTSVEVPLFHLRAVCVVAQPANKYVAFVERRVGEPIYLDEARRIARLMKMAEAIAEVAEVRLEYDASR